MTRFRRSPRYLRLREILIERRQSAGLTQIQLAERLGKPQSFVSKYEQGERRLDVIEFLIVVEQLGCRASDILERLAEISD